MADPDSVASLIDSTTSKIQKLQQAIAVLETNSAISLSLKWRELEEHFHGLEKSLKRRFDDLQVQEKEHASKAREVNEMLEKRETVVVSKELASLERLQEKRDYSLAEMFEKYRIPCPGSTTDAAVNGVLEANKVAKLDSDDTVGVKPCSEVTILCEHMDAEGLHKFVAHNRKNLTSIREEIPLALKGAPDPFSLVLDSLKDFYSGETLGLEGKKNGNLLGLRRTCLMLMESLEQLISEAVSAPLSQTLVLMPDIKMRAKLIASEWQPKLDAIDIDASCGNSLEAHAFLQLLATFGIASEFDEDEICKLIPAVSRRRQASELCKSLGLSQKMPGVIKVLVNSGRQIDAINLAYAFGLTEHFKPVPLLKTYLKEARKLPHFKAGNMPPGLQAEVDERELSALKAIVKCIEDHKLEEQYPVDPLQKRIHHLEKAKADEKRAAEAAKPQTKRARANGTIYSTRVTGFPDQNFYKTTPERYAYPYDPHYAFPAETHHPVLIASAPYTISPTHTTYYANPYQVQYQAPYLH